LPDESTISGEKGKVITKKKSGQEKNFEKGAKQAILR